MKVTIVSSDQLLLNKLSMKKKYLNGILIVLLIIIWGSLIYKYFGKQNNYLPSQELAYSTTDYKYIYGMTKDTSALVLINFNPFKATKRVKKQVNLKKARPKNQSNKTDKKTIVKWPNITYHGFVKGDSKATRLILLKIGNSLYRKREKETIKDVTLIKAFNDSLIVRYNNNKKTIKKIHD